MKIKQTLILTLLTIALQIYCANPRRYITQDGSGLKDGSSWENAGSAEELQDILDSVQDADIWIAKGIYKPTKPVSEPESERDITFGPNFNLIYGGFAGNETDLSQREIQSNETIFSGDIGIEEDNSDNCYHVMRAVQILDGITICDGNANGSVSPNASGGGVYVWSSPSIFRNCTFRDNYASQQGGAVFMDTSGYDVVFENCLFYNNESKYGGGGAVLSYYPNTTITNCTFVKNKSEEGGIISFVFDISNLNITNNVFWNNTGNSISYDNYTYSNSVTHNAIEGGYEGFGNINLTSENTGFKNSPYFTDPDNNDYSLLSLSPLIDKGVYWDTSCTTDITGNIRPQGTARDIGAYEYNSGPLTAVPPSVSTLSAAFTTVSTARVRGNVTSDGGSQMITKGVYYSTLRFFDPATQGTLLKYNQLYSDGEFYLDITNLPPSTTYYYRIYCENRVGSDIGEEMSFTTRSGVKPDGNGILYVKPDGTGDGSSWASALHGNDLQLGIDNTSVKEIWLAKGKYVPTSWPSGGSIERNRHFTLETNKTIYGGFNGTETALEQRDLKVNKTVLSGDIGAEGEYYDNTYRVIYNGNRDIDSTTVIDGITICDGNGDGIYQAGRGGGMYNGYSSPTIRNCTFENNRAVYGGGIYCYAAFPKFYNCAIVNNTALNAGGGLFHRNEYDYKENSAVYLRTIKMFHCTVAGNTALQGSQITFAQELWSDDSYIAIYNSIIWGAEPEILWCDIDNYHQLEEESRPFEKSVITFCGLSYPETGDGNIVLSRNNTGDFNSPYFTDPANNDYSLRYDSACKDMAVYRYATEKDINGISRPQGAAYDMGAYEYETSEPNALPPAIATGFAYSITVSSAVCHTNIITDGGIPLWQRGVKVSTIDGFDPATEGFLYSLKGDYTGTEYSNVVTALEPDSVYYFVPYAENRMGYAYGSDQGTFKTLNIIPDVGGIVYVKQDGTGNGSSWDNAVNGNDLQSAIYADSVKQVWVAKGTYYPTSWPSAEYYELENIDFECTDRSKHFSMKKGVELIGGFAGDEFSYEQRDYKLNETILSGDTGIEKDIADNIYTIIVNFAAIYLIDNELYYYPDIDSTAVIDGFTIRDCNNDDDDGYYNWREGGGMFNRYVGVKIKNCSFLNNFCISNGEAVYCRQNWDYFRPIIIDNCIFKNNSSSNGLGALFFSICENILVKNSAFFDNSGNGIWSDSNPVIKNCLFCGNGGTAISSYSRLTLINSTIVNNNGGLQFGWQNALTNNVIFNNVYDIKKTYKGKPDELPVINNCATSEIIDFEYTGSNNIIISKNNSGDPNSPYFSDPENGNWMIQEFSPLGNAGIWTADVPLYDIMGYLRDSEPDIGCYEYDPTSIEDTDNNLPLATELFQNYPNPFNPATNIKFALNKSGKVDLSVYNIAGQLVRKVIDKEMPAGYHSIKFEADNFNSGMYFYKLKAGGKELTKKMLMVK